MARGRHAREVGAAAQLREERLGAILASSPLEGADTPRWRLLDDPAGLARLHALVSEDARGQAWREAYRRALPSGREEPLGQPRPEPPLGPRPAL